MWPFSRNPSPTGESPNADLTIDHQLEQYVFLVVDQSIRLADKPVQDRLISLFCLLGKPPTPSNKPGEIA